MSSYSQKREKWVPFIQLDDVRVGSMIEYQIADGGHYAKVTGFGEEKGFIVVDLDDGHWAYLSQITFVTLY